MTTHDPVNHPAHYTSDPSGVECRTITRHRNFNIGSAIKYLWRAGLKDADCHVQDLEKAINYIRDEIERLGSVKGSESKPVPAVVVAPCATCLNNTPDRCQWKVFDVVTACAHWEKQEEPVQLPGVPEGHGRCATCKHYALTELDHPCKQCENNGLAMYPLRWEAKP